MAKSKYTKNTKIGVIIKNEEAAAILEKHRLPCLHCAMANYEIGDLKLGPVAEAYGLDVDKILKDLNKLKKKK